MLLCISSVDGFAVNSLHQRLCKLSMSTIREVVTTDTPKSLFTPQKLSSLNRVELEEFIVKLEKLNPTPDCANSPLLNGVWEIISTRGLTSLGLIGFQVVKALPLGDVLDITDAVVSISSKSPRVTATSKLKVGNARVDVQIVNDLTVNSAQRVTETYVSGKLGSIEFPKVSTALTRGMVISYLDEDLLVVRDMFGAPDVLRRMEKQFLPFSDTSSSETGSSTGEDGSPGA